jgi:AraC-like DNA-binding protein/lambda repressor-like predicted transcriptional regulator
MYVSISYVRSVLDEVQRQGISAATLCAHAGVDPSELTGTERVTVARYDRIVRSACDLSPASALGLRVGAHAPPGALDVVGYILATCSTIREAFGQFTAYSPLVKEGGRWGIIESGASARFTYEHDVIAPDNARFDAESCLALVLKIGRQFIGFDNQPDVVRFRHEAPAYASEYQSVFPCEVLFGQATNEIVFSRSFLDMEQLHRDERLRVLLQGRAAELLERRTSNEAFLEQIRDVLKIEAESGAPHVGRLARRLGVTLRTLERRLHERGLSLARMVEEARREAACTALRVSSGSIERVAYRLGFSEPSAFHRAFKRWTGMTPRRYRETAALDQASKTPRAASLATMAE